MLMKQAHEERESLKRHCQQMQNEMADLTDRVGVGVWMCGCVGCILCIYR